MLIILIVYFALLVAFIIFSVAAVYHLNRFGYVGDLTRPIMVIYIMLSIIVITTTLILIATRSWPTGLNL